MKTRLSLFFLIVLTTKFLPLSSVTWATPILEQPSAQSLIVTDEQGNILEISQRKEGLNSLVQAQTYNQSTNSWSPYMDLSGMDSNAHNFKLATDPQGNAIVLWQISDGIHECVQTASYDVLTDKWTPTQNLSGFEKDLVITHLAMNERGDAFAAWKQKDQNISKTITFSRAANKWSALKSQILPVKNHQQSRFFLDTKNNAILINEINK
jgi:hypothetical protein